MRTEVEVVSPEEYEAFIKSQKADIQAAQDRVVGLIEIGRNAMRAPELVVDGFPKRRARWVEIATSADHKDVGRILIVSSLGFLFVALIELLLMRLQLAIPENTFLSPVAFNRMLSMYGATAIFFFAVPLVARLLLLRGAAADRRPRHGAAAGRPARRLARDRRARPCSTRASSSPPRRPGSTRCRRSRSWPSSPTTASTPGPRRPAWRRSASS